MRELKLLIIPLIACLSLAVVHKSAHALYIAGDDGGSTSNINNNSPPIGSGYWNPPSTTYPGSGNISGNIQPYYVVGNNTTLYNHPKAQIKVYLKDSTLTNLTIKNAGPNCQAPVGGGLVGPDYSQNATGAGPRTDYWIQTPTGAKLTQIIDTSQCIDAVLGPISDTEGFSSTEVPGYSHYIYLIANIPPQSIVGENSFTITSSSGANVGFSSGYTGYGFRDRDVTPGNYWTQEIKFGVNKSCTDDLTSGETGSVDYADADQANPGWNPNLHILLQEKPWDTNLPQVWTTRIDRGPAYLAANNNGSILNGSFSPAYRYRVILQNVGPRNTIFISMSPKLSQIAGTYHLEAGDCSGAAHCTAVPASQTVGLNSSAVINVRLYNDSPSGGKTYGSNYTLRQVAPGGASIGVSPNLGPGANEMIGPYNINARSTAQTVNFSYQLFDPGGTAVGSPCPAQITWKSTPGGVSCDAGLPQTVPVGQGATISVTLTNNSGGALPGTYEVRQVVPGGQVKGLGSSLANNSSRPLPGYSINARTTPQTVVFNYTLFNGPNAGSAAVGTNPLCQTQITWGTCTVNCTSGLPTSFTVACGQTHVYNLSSTATTSTSSPGGAPYLTYQPPPWATPPVPAGSPFIPGIPTYLYTPPPVVTNTTVTSIPVHFHFDGSDGSSNDVNTSVPNPTSDQPFDTFNDFGFLWPHIAYTVTMEAQTSNAGMQQFGSQQLNGDCLDVACGVGSSPDAEPGQTRQLSYGIHVLKNNTNKTFSSSDGNGYHFGIGTSAAPSLTNVSGGSTTGDISPGTPDINVNFSATINYRASFWPIMYFQGGVLGSLPGLPGGSCPPAGVIPATRAYFDVRGADIATGGGFSSAAGVCPSAAPYYVSPATGYSSGSGPYDYAGGIRAYGNPNGGIGGSSEFGVLSLGLTIGSPTGPVGFFSRHNDVFANTGVPNAPNGGNLGGYLSPAGATSSHCVDDYYTKTRITDVTPTTFSGNTITGLPNGQYQATGDVTLNRSDIAVGQRVTLYVDGNVTITDDIAYASNWDPTDRSNVPYFTLIVKGNVTLTSGVDRIDGLYIVQPINGQEGLFSTCNDFCPNQLVVNGAVIAQQVALTRAHGTLGPLVQDVNNLGTTPAEVFNYTPALIIGLPYFNPNYNSLQALFSLPPVF